MNAGVHFNNECRVDLACPQLLLLGSRHKDLLAGSTAVFLADSSPWLMNVGIYSHNGRLVDQPCPLPARHHRDLLLDSTAVFLADSRPRLMNVGVHCHNAQPAGQLVGQPCPQLFPQLLPPDSPHRDLLPHEEHHFLPSDPLNLKSRELLPLVPGTPAILPPRKMSPSNRCPRLVMNVEGRVAQHLNLQPRTQWLLGAIRKMTAEDRPLRSQTLRGEISRMLSFLVVDLRKSRSEMQRLQMTVASPHLLEMAPNGLVRPEMAMADDSLPQAAISMVPGGRPHRSRCEGGGLGAAVASRLRPKEGPRRHRSCEDFLAPKRSRMRCSPGTSARRNSTRTAALCLLSQRRPTCLPGMSQIRAFLYLLVVPELRMRSCLCLHL